MSIRRERARDTRAREEGEREERDQGASDEKEQHVHHAPDITLSPLSFTTTCACCPVGCRRCLFLPLALSRALSSFSFPLSLIRAAPALLSRALSLALVLALSVVAPLVRAADLSAAFCTRTRIGHVLARRSQLRARFRVLLLRCACCGAPVSEMDGTPRHLALRLRCHTARLLRRSLTHPRVSGRSHRLVLTHHIRASSRRGAWRERAP